MNFPLKYASFLSCLLMTIVLLTGCKKDKSEKISIEGFRLTNPNGDVYGNQGSTDDDWKFAAGAGFNADILALFDFPVNLDISDTKEVSLSYIWAYPNPASLSQSYAVISTGTVLLKIVVVDKDLRVLNKQAMKLQNGTSVMLFDFHDRNIYPNKKELRVYYSLSAPGKPNYQVGYGDIKICEDNLNDCF